MRLLVFCFLLSVLSPSLAVADFSGPVVSILDGDTIEVLLNHHPTRIRLPQSQGHPKERRLPLNRKNGEAHILACHHLSYGNHKINAPSAANAPTNNPGIMVTSMITSWVDGGFAYV